MDYIFNHAGELESQYLRSISRLFFLDYDGTLEPYDDDRKSNAPSKEVQSMLLNLASDDSNQVVVISGRNRKDLEWFTDIPVMLVAEHGGFHKKYGEDWTTYFDENVEWKTKAYSVLRALTLQYEGSFIDEKHYSLTWHYGRSTEVISETEKRKIIAAINLLPFRNEFFIYDQSQAIEFRTKGIDKGRFAKKVIREQRSDFIFGIGDGATDEDLFEGLGKAHFTIKVGQDVGSSARFFLADQREVIPLLNKCVQLSQRLQGKIR